MSCGVTATAHARPEIVLLVAAADNGVIGAAGAIPWRLKTDQQRLKMMTMTCPHHLTKVISQSLYRHTESLS